MSIKNLSVILFRMEKRHIIRRLSLVALCAISVVMIHMSVFEIVMSNYEINVVKSLFPERNKLYNINIFIDNQSVGYEQYVKEFIHSLSGIQGVKMSGVFFDFNCELEELKDSEDFLNYNQRLCEGTEREGYPSFINMYYVDKSMLSLLNLNDLKRPKKGDVLPLLVGSDYTGFLEKGKIYTDEMGVRYQVCGELPRDFIIPSSGLFWSELPYENLNKSIVTFYDRENVSSNRFIINACNSIYCETDGSSETEERINELAKQYFVRISINTINEKIKEYKVQEKNSIEVAMLFSIIISVGAFLAIISSNIIQIIVNKREYGIMYANGISYIDGIKIIIMQNFVCISCAFAIATVYSINKVNNNSVFEAVRRVEIFKEFCVVKSLGIVFILFLICTIVPIVILGNMQIVDMIRGDE